MKVRRFAAYAITVVLIASGVALCGIAPASAAPACTASPFESSSDTNGTGPFYRIPSVVKAPNGTLIAFAESRSSYTSDYSDTDIAQSLSSDDGCTWSAPSTIVADGTNHLSNPLPIVDSVAGKVLLMYRLEKQIGTDSQVMTHFYQMSTTDGGTTWSAPQLVESEGNYGPIPVTNYMRGVTAPGNGIQLVGGSHPGRLVFAAGGARSDGFSGVALWYSDDHGASWTVQANPPQLPGDVKPIEMSVTQVSGDRLLMTMRRDNSTASLDRYFAYSDDAGGSFTSDGWTVSPPQMTPVYANLLTPTGEYSSYVFMSGPTVVDPDAPLTRRNVGIWASPDGGQTWGTPYPLEIDLLGGGYSDLVQLSDARIGVLYESGNSASTFKDKIQFMQVQIADVLSPPQVSADLSGSVLNRPSVSHASTQASTVTVRATVPGMSNSSSAVGQTNPRGRVFVTLEGSSSGTSATWHSETKVVPLNGEVSIPLPLGLNAGTYDATITYAGSTRIAQTVHNVGVLTVTPATLSSTNPTISGSASAGELLISNRGPWTSGTSFAYEWLRNGSVITGATGTNYTLTSADVGAKISVRVTGSKPNYATKVLTSPQTATVSAGTLSSTKPTVTGTVRVGEKLVSHRGPWTAGTTFTYQWLRDGVAIPGARGTSYILVAADWGKKISVRVTGSKTNYPNKTLTSTQTAAIKAGILSSTDPTIIGSPEVGNTLKANRGPWTSGTSFTYQWLRNGQPIAGAGGTSYSLVSADKGARISVSVTGTKYRYISRTLTTQQTTTVR